MSKYIKCPSSIGRKNGQRCWCYRDKKCNTIIRKVKLLYLHKVNRIFRLYKRKHYISYEELSDKINEKFGKKYSVKYISKALTVRIYDKRLLKYIRTILKQLKKPEDIYKIVDMVKAMGEKEKKR